MGSLTVIQHLRCSRSYQRLVIGIALSVLFVGCSSTPSGGVRVVVLIGNAVAQRPTVTTGLYVV
ncbi:peptigoglycan-binding protein LysM, partial [Pseudomonas syringae pv. tagetis]